MWACFVLFTVLGRQILPVCQFYKSQQYFFYLFQIHILTTVFLTAQVLIFLVPFVMRILKFKLHKHVHSKMSSLGKQLPLSQSVKSRNNVI